MSESVKIPNGLVNFTTDAGSFDVPVAQFSLELRALREKYWNDPNKPDHHAFLNEVIGIVRDRFNGVLTIGEADWFVDQVETEWAKKKQKQAKDTKDTLNSVFSMASQPSDSATTN